jgi:hypothetical protein
LPTRIAADPVCNPGKIAITTAAHRQRQRRRPDPSDNAEGKGEIDVWVTKASLMGPEFPSWVAVLQSGT